MKRQVVFKPYPLHFPFMTQTNKRLMGVKKLDLKEWVELDEFSELHTNLRKKIVAEQREEVFASRDNPSTEEAKHELLELIVKHLLEFHSDKFGLTENGEQKIIQSYISGDEYRIDRKGMKEDPLLICSLLVQDDFVILENLYKETGEEKYKASPYVLTAGAVIFPLKWSVREKFMLPMQGIHFPVEEYKQHLVNPVEKLFGSMKVEGPVQRGNWLIPENQVFMFPKK